MSLFKKLSYLGACCLALSACGGSSGGGSSNNGGGGGPNLQKVLAVNIGNVSVIPVTGNQTTTSLIVTNNTNSNLHLVDGNINQDGIKTNIKISETTHSNAFGMVNISQCSSLQASGTCSVTVTTPAANGNYLLTLNFIDTATGKTYTSSQVVTYSNTIPATGGFTYSNLNNNLYNVPGGSTTYAIPFVLDNNYTTLYTYSNNPAFATSLSCPGGTTYAKGDLCTVYVKVAGLGDNPSVTAIVTVSTEPNPHPSLNAQSAKQIGIKGAIGYSFNTSVTVSNSVVGNIVSSAFNVVVNPADGTAPQSVTLLNNGSATVTNIAITPVGGIINIVNGGAGSCAASSNSLAPGASCTFSVNANTQTNGSNTVNITYNNGGTGNTNGVLPFTVVYISATPGPGMSMTAGQGSLQNAVIGFNSALNIQVTNTGNVALTNIAFTNITAVYGPEFTYDAASTCNTTGSQSLPIGGQCTLIVDYLPTTQSSGNITINPVAQYNSSGTNNSYQGSSFSTAYSSFAGNAFVYMSPISVAYAIRADNTDTATQVITVANFGGQTATLSSPSYNESGLSSIASAIHITDGCAGFTLNPNNGNNCTLTVTFGPESTAVPVTSGYLFMPYKTIPTAIATVNAFSQQIFQAESAALVTVTGPVKSGAAGGSGLGTSVSPYLFYNSPVAGKPIVLTYTYTNSGTAAANIFAVGLNNLPIGWTLQSATCSTGATSIPLNTGSSCNVVITAISPGTFANPYAATGPINVVTPSFSYTDTNTGLNTGPASPVTTYVTPQIFANVASNNLTHTTATAGGSYNVTFTSSAGGDTSEYPITITIPSTSLPSGPGTPIYVTSANSCTIATATGNCTINITNIAGAAPGAYTFQYWVTPTGLSAALSNSILQYFSFTLN